MGTCRYNVAIEIINVEIIHSYVLTGTEKGFEETFGSTCHGAVSYFTYF